MIHILNNLTSDNDLQFALMERRVGDADKLLTIEEVRGELNLRFERLNMKPSRNEEGEVLEEQALFSGQFKGKCRNCSQVGHKSFPWKNRSSHSGGNNGNGTGAIFCLYCHKPGHDKKSSFKLKKKKPQNGHASNFNSNTDRRNYESRDVVFTATLKNKILTDDIWICESGAWGYYCKSHKGLFDVKDINEKITVGNDESMMATKVGSLKCNIIQLNGSSVDVTLKEVKYVPELWVNLFNISKALKKGFDLSNKGLTISLKKGSVSVTFDRVIKTVNGSVSGIKMTSYDSSVAYIAKGRLTAIKEIDVNKFHEMIVHCGVDRLKKTANIHGLKLKGEFKVCEDCAVAKARQRNVNQDWKGGSQVPGERVI
jgi:hypothetical protein